MNLVVAFLTLSIGLLGAYFARAPEAWESAASARRAGSATAAKPIITSKKSFSVKESLHTRSFWLLWITWTFAGAAGVSMTCWHGTGLFLGFLILAILILTALISPTE
jgi:hypothetical protein